MKPSFSGSVTLWNQLDHRHVMLRVSPLPMTDTACGPMSDTFVGFDLLSCLVVEVCHALVPSP